MSNVSSSNGLDKRVPKLRFPEFSGDWHNYNMGQIYTERKESGNDKLPILTVSIHTGVSDGALDETELGKRVKRSEDKSTYKIARKNDLVFNMMRAWQGAIGTVRTTGMVSPAYIVAYPNDLVEPIFMDYLVKCKQMIDSIHRLSYGVTDFRLRLYWDSFVEIPINVPSLEEQNKIASFLTLLDKRITKQRELVEHLKSYKRGLLSDVFPQNDEWFPKLRLSGFNDKWQYKAMKEIGETFGGLTGKSKEDFGHGNARFVTYMNVFSNPISDCSMLEPIEIDESQKEIKYGDIFFTTSSETPEEVGMSSVWLGNQPHTYLNSFCFGFRPTIDIDQYFLAYLMRSKGIRSKIVLLAQGISRYNISKTKMLEIKLPLPSNAEQVKIGRLFKNIDIQLYDSEKKLTEMESMKKALLRYMFI